MRSSLKHRWPPQAWGRFLALLFVLVSAACDQNEKAQAGAPVRVAVATNFLRVGQRLALLFERDSGIRVEILPGSSGKLFAQIVQGAPYDVLLSADVERPKRLVREGHAVAGTSFVYARGVLVLWCSKGTQEACRRLSRQEALAGARLSAWLGGLGRLALADPRTAPYGLAGKQTLQHLSLWQKMRGGLIVGESVGQAYQFIQTDNVDAGLIALSQLKQAQSDYVLIPKRMYRPIRQQAVLLREGSGAREFLHFLRTNSKARTLIEEAGYLSEPSGGEVEP